MKNINNSCQGASHLKSGKPCQDASRSYSSRRISYAIVSDGHGGDHYFRSDIGSKLLVEITESVINEFVFQIKDENLFRDKPFSDFSMEVAEKNPHITECAEHKALVLLFTQIIYKWNQAVEKHALEHDLTEWEEKNVADELKIRFREKRNGEKRTSGFEHNYGCTLIAYFQTPEYWIAFQLGDGKCVTISFNGSGVNCVQPIPWDSKCFLNKTTSICDSNALEEFRYCFGKRSTQPMAVFLGSDGIDDTFGDGNKLYDFYLNIVKELLRDKGSKNTSKILRNELPVISKIGSQDDMSIANVFSINPHKIGKQRQVYFSQIINWQKSLKYCEIEEFHKKISSRNDIIKPLEILSILTTSQSAELSIARKELERFKTQIQKAEKKIKELEMEKL